MSDYTRELVEQLLPAVWDQGYAYGLADPYAPDPDMPRATIDPARANTLYALLADIRIAWTKTPLTNGERRTLFLRYALDWPQKRIANFEEISQTTVSERLQRTVSRIADHLSGWVYTHSECPAQICTEDDSASFSF